MGNTYLKLANKVGARVGEVQLTSSNFAAAEGIFDEIKNAINDAIAEIYMEGVQWPFAYTEQEDAMIAGTQVYAFPATAVSVDMDTFYLKRDATLGVAGRPLVAVTYDEWNRWVRSNDEEIIANIANTSSVPQRVIRGPNEEYIVTPPPDDTYGVKYSFWAGPTALSAHGDTTLIPIVYDKVILDGAMIYMGFFKDNQEKAAALEAKFKAGIKDMRKTLINPTNSRHVYDLRTAAGRGTRARGARMYSR